MESGLRSGHTADHAHNPAHLRACLRISGIGRLTQAGVACQLIGKKGDLLLQLQTLMQSGSRVGILKTLHKACEFGDHFFQCLKIGMIGRVVKAFVDAVEIPYFIHSADLLNNYRCCYFTTGKSLRQLSTVKPVLF